MHSVLRTTSALKKKHAYLVSRTAVQWRGHLTIFALQQLGVFIAACLLFRGAQAISQLAILVSPITSSLASIQPPLPPSPPSSLACSFTYRRQQCSTGCTPITDRHPYETEHAGKLSDERAVFKRTHASEEPNGRHMEDQPHQPPKFRPTSDRNCNCHPRHAMRDKASRQLTFFDFGRR